MDRRMGGRVVVKSRMLQHKDQKEGRTSAREEKEESNNVMVPGELLECLLTVKQEIDDSITTAQPAMEGREADELSCRDKPGPVEDKIMGRDSRNRSTRVKIPTKRPDAAVEESEVKNTSRISEGSSSSRISEIAQSNFVDAIMAETDDVIVPPIPGRQRPLSSTPLSNERRHATAAGPPRRRSFKTVKKTGLKTGSTADKSKAGFARPPPQTGLAVCGICGRASGQLDVHSVLHHYKEQILTYSVNRNQCVFCNEKYTDVNELALHIGFFHRVLKDLELKKQIEEENLTVIKLEPTVPEDSLVSDMLLQQQQLPLTQQQQYKGLPQQPFPLQQEKQQQQDPQEVNMQQQQKQQHLLKETKQDSTKQAEKQIKQQLPPHQKQQQVVAKPEQQRGVKVNPEKLDKQQQQLPPQQQQKEVAAKPQQQRVVKVSPEKLNKQQQQLPSQQQQKEVAAKPQQQRGVKVSPEKLNKQQQQQLPPQQQQKEVAAKPQQQRGVKISPEILNKQQQEQLTPQQKEQDVAAKPQQRGVKVSSEKLNKQQQQLPPQQNQHQGVAKPHLRGVKVNTVNPNLSPSVAKSSKPADKKTSAVPKGTPKVVEQQGKGKLRLTPPSVTKPVNLREKLKTKKSPAAETVKKFSIGKSVMSTKIITSTSQSQGERERMGTRGKEVGGMVRKEGWSTKKVPPRQQEPATLKGATPRIEITSRKREATGPGSKTEPAKKEVKTITKHEDKKRLDPVQKKPESPIKIDRQPRVACGVCVKCKLPDCGNCVVCQDNPKFGGQGRGARDG